MRRGAALTILLLVQCLGASGTKSAALDKAVAELKKAYAAHAKNASGASLRTECDYFSAETAAAIPADALLGVLEKPLSGADGRQTAYVKWQLLSALPASPDEATVRRLLKVYERRAAPALRFGCARGEQKELDKLLAGARPQDDVDLNARLDEAVNRGFEADRPVIAYRDELYKRLPMSRDKFALALRDAAERVRVGAQKDVLADALSVDLPGWALTTADAERGHVREVAELVGKLRLVESPPYYKYASVRRGKLTWVSDTDTLLTTKKLATLHKTLLDAGNGGSGAKASPEATKDKKAGNNP